MNVRKGEYSELAALFFLQSMATGMWMVPLSRVLDAHGYPHLRPYAFAASALAAFVSPLIFGAMADRHASPVRVLRWLSVASAAGMALATWSIALRLPSAAVMVMIQAYAVCTAPTSSIVNTIVFSRLTNSPRQFGPLRAVATVGWMCGCWIISALNADATSVSGFSGAGAWLGLALVTCFLPAIPPPASKGAVGFRERMGWDALVLLRNPDHRVVFISAALFSIPLAAFYPFTPVHLRQLGLERTSAWMSLGQVTEIIAMLSLASLLLKVRLKWIFGAGLLFGLIRFVCCALDQKGWVLAGVTLHGASFTLFFITGQIYLNERVEHAWRARAQALMVLMTGGVGNLVGYLGTGFWLRTCSAPARVNWTLFWAGLASVIALVTLYFLRAYRGKGTGLHPAKPVALKPAG